MGFRLENSQKCLKMLKIYGRHHQKVGIPPTMLGYMGRSFMAAIQPTLSESEAWDEETEDAWHSLFKLITYGMRKGYEENKENPSKEAASLQEGTENLQAVDVNSDENVFE